MKVIDASVAAKWFIDEKDSGTALQVLTELESHPAEFITPELFFVEMLSVLSRACPSVERLKQALTDLEELGIARLEHGHGMLEQAAEFCKSYGLSAYDAIYAATAAVCNATWVTADKHAHQRIAHLHLSQLLK